MVQFLSEAGFVSTPKHPDQFWDLSSLLFNGHPGIFHYRSYDRGMKLITTPSSERFRMNGGIFPIPLCFYFKDLLLHCHLSLAIQGCQPCILIL